MAIEVELNIFSGRRNPIWKLTPAQEDVFLSKLTKSRAQPATNDQAAVKAPILGYRGFEVRAADDERLPDPLTIFGGIIRQGERGFPDPDRGLERWLISTAPSQIDEKVLQVVERDLERT
jgi:hypothetical protein